MASKIVELAQSGRMQALDDLLAQTPESVAEMLQIKGLGAKSGGHLAGAGVKHPENCCMPVMNKHPAKLKGFGDKTQQA